jgi:hypothetical protein
MARSVDPAYPATFSASQQHGDRESPAQQELVVWPEYFAEQADASPATDSITAIAARAMEGRRT